MSCRSLRGGWFLCVAWLLAPAVLRATEPYDVLMIVVDDLNDGIQLFDPKSEIETPNLVRLAKRGVFFRRAYCISPACNPSRTATLTGLRPSRTGIYGNRSDWRRALPKRPTIMQRFRKAGYNVRGAGKIFHHGGTGRDDPDNPSFQEFFKKLAIRGPGPNKNYNDVTEEE